MLVLTRVREQAVMVGDDVIVRVMDVRGNQVRLGITAPPEVAVDREEIYKRKHAEKGKPDKGR